MSENLNKYNLLDLDENISIRALPIEINYLENIIEKIYNHYISEYNRFKNNKNLSLATYNIKKFTQEIILKENNHNEYLNKLKTMLLNNEIEIPHEIYEEYIRNIDKKKFGTSNYSIDINNKIGSLLFKQKDSNYKRISVDRPFLVNVKRNSETIAIYIDEKNVSLIDKYPIYNMKINMNNSYSLIPKFKSSLVISYKNKKILNEVYERILKEIKPNISLYDVCLGEVEGYEILDKKDEKYYIILGFLIGNSINNRGNEYTNYCITSKNLLLDKDLENIKEGLSRTISLYNNENKSYLDEIKKEKFNKLKKYNEKLKSSKFLKNRNNNFYILIDKIIDNDLKNTDIKIVVYLKGYFFISFYKIKNYEIEIKKEEIFEINNENVNKNINVDDMIHYDKAFCSSEEISELKKLISLKNLKEIDLIQNKDRIVNLMLKKHININLYEKDIFECYLKNFIKDQDKYELSQNFKEKINSKKIKIYLKYDKLVMCRELKLNSQYKLEILTSNKFLFPSEGNIDTDNLFIVITNNNLKEILKKDNLYIHNIEYDDFIKILSEEIIIE